MLFDHYLFLVEAESTVSNRYYPSAQAYYDVERKMYFCLEGDNWRVSVSLPVSLQAKIGDYVTIGMESDRPYTAFEEHRSRYPVGR